MLQASTDRLMLIVEERSPEDNCRSFGRADTPCVFRCVRDSRVSVVWYFHQRTKWMILDELVFGAKKLFRSRLKFFLLNQKAFQAESFSEMI